jgi:FixJ family two-component response regulator
MRQDQAIPAGMAKDRRGHPAPKSALCEALVQGTDAMTIQLRPRDTAGSTDLLRVPPFGRLPAPAAAALLRSEGAFQRSGPAAGRGQAAAGPAPAAERWTAYIVDQDAEIRDRLSALLESVDIEARCCGSAADLPTTLNSDGPCVLILDVRLPGLSGLDLQRRLSSMGVVLPLIFMTAHADIQMAVGAMKAGASDFLTKPFRDQDMLDAVFAGIAQDQARRQSLRPVAEIRTRYGTLSAREKEVMAAVVSGLLNKQIAGNLGLSEVTIKLHRSKVMRKMKARSVPDLVRQADALTAAAATAARAPSAMPGRWEAFV